MLPRRMWSISGVRILNTARPGCTSKQQRMSGLHVCRRIRLSREITGRRTLTALAEEAVARALQAGAADAEAVAYEGEEFSVKVRLGQVEELTESGSRAMGLRVFFNAAGDNGQ